MNTGNTLEHDDLNNLINQLADKASQLKERERDLADKAEELASQKEELTAAIEELIDKNNSLAVALNQLRDRNFELDQILYRTSHDLRAPLSSIKGIIALLKLEPQSDTIKNYGQHIEDKSIQMDNLLRSLASLSKSILEDPVMSIVNLDTTIRQVIDEFRHLPAWNNIEIRITLQEETIHADRFLITIIFQSLFSNAFTFRDVHKKGFLSIHSFQKDKKTIIEVHDDGEGIAPSIQPHIFEMFYRGSEKSSGNGLGLYIARKAAAQLNGSVEVHVTPGNTCFTISLPHAD